MGCPTSITCVHFIVKTVMGAIELYVPIRGRKFRHRKFCRGKFHCGKFRRKEIWPYGNFNARKFRRRKFPRREISLYGNFAVKYFCPMEISLYTNLYTNRFSLSLCTRCLNISSSECLCNYSPRDTYNYLYPSTSTTSNRRSDFHYTEKHDGNKT